VCACVCRRYITREPFEIITKYSREQDTVKKNSDELENGCIPMHCNTDLRHSLAELATT